MRIYAPKTRRGRENYNKETRRKSLVLDHTRLLEAKALLAEVHLEDIKKLLARELHIKHEFANQAHFFISLKIKKKKSTISSIMDAMGKVVHNPNLMLNHLIQIIGQLDDCLSKSKKLEVHSSQ